MNLQTLRDLLTECQTQATYHEGKAEAWNDAARLIEGKIESEEASPSISEGDTLTFTAPDGEEFTATVKGAATSADGGEVTVNAVLSHVSESVQSTFAKPVERLTAKDRYEVSAPSGTVALEYKFGVGDVIELRTLRYEITGLTPTHYLAKCFDLPGSLQSRIPVENMDMATLIRRAGEGEKQAEKADSPLRQGAKVELCAEPCWMDQGKVVPRDAQDADRIKRRFKDTVATIRDPHRGNWSVYFDGRFEFYLHESCLRVVKPARPAYKAGQVWRNKEGDLLTLISQHLGLGGWYWKDHNGAKGFSYFPDMDRHWTFVSDAPEAAP